MTNKIKEVLDAYCNADTALVDSWNREFGWGRQPYVEDHVQFMRARLDNTMKALTLIAQTLVDERAVHSAEGGPNGSR